MRIVLSGRNKAKAVRRAALVLLVLMLAMLTWLPNLLSTASNKLTGDMLFEQTAQKILCGAGPMTGWPINNGSIGETLGSFSPSLPAYLVARTACTIGDTMHISGLQAFLIVGITLTVLITFVSSRAVGLGLNPSLLISYGLATAPCSFSRIGHLQLSQLWPIMPCIAICALLLARDRYPVKPGRNFQSTGLFGLAMGIFSFTAQEYYAVFSILCTATCYTSGWAIATKEANRPAQSKHTQATQSEAIETRYYYAKIAAGYAIAMILYLATKQLLWNIPEWAHEATSRPSIEQFWYNFWPSNIVTSPLLNDVLQKIFVANDLPANETPFGSSSGILVIIGLALSPFCWIKATRSSSGDLTKSDALILAFGGVLVSTIAIACLVATAGGLGTLFAVFISPQLRALNRITPYFYCAALVVCAIRFDQVVSAIVRRGKTGTKT